MTNEERLRIIIKKLIRLIPDDQLQKVIRIVEGVDVWDEESRARVDRIRKETNGG